MKKSLKSTSKKPSEHPQYPLRLPPLSQKCKTTLLWLHSFRPPFTSLVFPILREVCSYLSDSSPPVVPSFQCNSFRLFDPRTGWGPVVRCSTQVPFQRSSRCVVVDSVWVVVCGGTAFIQVRSEGVDHWESEVSPRYADMQYARSSHGILHFSRCVLVFGGREMATSLSSCECLSLSKKPQWQRFGPMAHARGSCSPVLWRAAVYVCGGFSVIEVMDLSSGTFTPRPLRVPSVTDVLMGWVRGDDLVVFARSHITVVDSAGRVVQSTPHKLELADSETVPVVYQGNVYLMRDGRVTVLDAATGELSNSFGAPLEV